MMVEVFPSNHDQLWKIMYIFVKNQSNLSFINKIESERELIFGKIKPLLGELYLTLSINIICIKIYIFAMSFIFNTTQLY